MRQNRETQKVVIAEATSLTATAIRTLGTAMKKVTGNLNAQMSALQHTLQNQADAATLTPEDPTQSLKTMIDKQGTELTKVNAELADLKFSYSFVDPIFVKALKINL